MNDGVVDDSAVALDLARVRKLLVDLIRPSLALGQMVELAHTTVTWSPVRRREALESPSRTTSETRSEQGKYEK